MPKYKREVTQYIEDNVDILDVVGSAVALKKAGRSYKGLCPFHGEKTPSFVVSPDKGFYHCFGCGAGGGAINFVMNYENLGFIDAIESIADQYNIDLSSMLDTNSQNQSYVKTADYYEVMRLAARYYYNCFKHSPVAQQYVSSRGLSPEVIKRFGIGYAPDGWQNLINVLEKEGISKQLMSDCGLIIKNDNSRYYDRFRNRLMFPIFDIRNRVIAFGGRVLDDSLPKYLNSPETLIFHKSNVLYGLNYAKNQVKAQTVKRVILAEGYMDVVSLYQYGYACAVASLGTALTKEHVKKLDRVFDELVFAFDADKAGRSAIMKSLPILEKSNLNVKILDLSGAKDPDEILKKGGRAAFDRFIDSALSTLEFSIMHIEKDYDLNNPDARIKFLHSAYTFINDYNVPSAQSLMLEYLAKRVKLKSQVISADYIAWQKQLPADQYEDMPSLDSFDNYDFIDSDDDPPNTLSPIERDTLYKIEEKLLKFVLNDRRDYLKIHQKIKAFYYPELDEIYQYLETYYSHHEKILIDNMIDVFSLDIVGIIDSIVRGVESSVTDRDLLRVIYRHKQLAIDKQIEEIDTLLEKHKLSSHGDDQVKYREALVKRMSLQKMRKKAVSDLHLV